MKKQYIAPTLMAYGVVNTEILVASPTFAPGEVEGGEAKEFTLEDMELITE